MMTDARSGSAITGALGLCTDLYELRMVDSYYRAGMIAPATFSLFVRPAPERPWLLALGVHRVLELLERFRFGPEELDYLAEIGVSEATRAELASFEPTGALRAVPDGTVVLGGEPILELTAPLPVAQLFETAVMNLVQLPTLVATKAARIAFAAEGRPVVDFGFRRAHGLETGVEAALAAYVGGGMATSNVEAGRRYGLRVVGTMAHSFVQAFDSEIEAFRAFARDHPGNVVLLVDTYDTLDGVRNAIAVADELRERGEGLQAVRLDSGPLVDLAKESRRLLDEAGHTDVGIFASGGLDEERIRDLLSESAPVDAFGVGSTLVVSKDQPVCDIVYKLVSYDGRARAKYSGEKTILPGEKQIFRSQGPDTDVLGLRDEQLPGTPLLEVVWEDGRRLRELDLEATRERARRELSAVPADWRLPPGPPAPPEPALSAGLRALDEQIRPRGHHP